MHLYSDKAWGMLCAQSCERGRDARALWLLFRHSAESENAQDERLATSPSMLTRLHLPRAIVMRLLVREINAVILIAETAVTVGA